MAEQETFEAAGSKPAIGRPGSITGQSVPTGGLSIAGRLVNLDGEPVPGIEIVAHRYDAQRGPLDSGGYRTQSDLSGHYAFGGMAPGDYEVQTVATGVYPATRSIFRAGLESADIRLASSSTAQVYGTIMDTSGTPLTGVEVDPDTLEAGKAISDAAGNYRINLSVADPARSFTLRFQLPDYFDERVHLESRNLASGGQTRVDVRLRRRAETTTVSGRLRSEDGAAVPGEIVQLHSPSLRTDYMARSDGDGNFSLPAVEPAPDYVVLVHPQGAYRTYLQQGVLIEGPGRSLAITLLALETGRLSGRMIDVEGSPLAGFSLLLQSSSSQGRLLTVSADDAGYFVVENAPAGNLLFSTQSEPRLVVSGIALAPGAASSVDVVIDWGGHELSGRVRDELGNPLPGAELKLSWTHDASGTHSMSWRRAVADGNGLFRFTQLGAGAHQLEAVAPGYQGTSRLYVVGRQSGEVDVELRKASP